jgi:hypothetical protein
MHMTSLTWNYELQAKILGFERKNRWQNVLVLTKSTQSRKIMSSITHHISFFLHEALLYSLNKLRICRWRRRRLPKHEPDLITVLVIVVATCYHVHCTTLHWITLPSYLLLAHHKTWKLLDISLHSKSFLNSQGIPVSSRKKTCLENHKFH